jgi:hypothetical protein
VIHCPCCFQPIPDEPDLCAHFAGNFAIILDALETAGKRGLLMEHIADAVWGADPTSGPQNPANNVRATITRYRPRLRSLGHDIVLGYDGRYRLVKFDPAFPPQQPRRGGYRPRRNTTEVHP